MGNSKAFLGFKQKEENAKCIGKRFWRHGRNLLICIEKRKHVHLNRATKNKRKGYGLSNHLFVRTYELTVDVMNATLSTPQATHSHRKPQYHNTDDSPYTRLIYGMTSTVPSIPFSGSCVKRGLNTSFKRRMTVRIIISSFIYEILMT